MKCFALSATVFPTLISLCSSAPVLIWKNGQSSEKVEHSSEAIDASSLIESTVQSADHDSSLASVIFLVGRDSADGGEGLTKLTYSGALPNVASKYGAASSVYHHIHGLESSFTVARDARKGLPDNEHKHDVVEVTFDQFQQKLSSMNEENKEDSAAEVSPSGEVQIISKSERTSRKLAKKLKAARVLVVKAPFEEDLISAKLDDAVAAAIDHEQISSVVLAGIRSSEEVKLERRILAAAPMMEQSRRRLDQQADDDAGNDSSGVYYVNMTPNIFSAILFFLFFAFVAYTGISCMNLIEGQDVYVSKMPIIGREA